MCFLMVIGLVITAVVWSNFGPVAGIVAGFLLIGGSGWKLIGGLAVSAASPGSNEFISAWEARNGEMRKGEPTTYPPPGYYQAWRKANQTNGETASDWLKRMATAQMEHFHKQILDNADLGQSSSTEDE